MFCIKKLIEYKKILSTLSIFLFIFLLLGLPFANWGFLHDDWGVIYHAWTTGNNLPALFTEGSMTMVVQPANYILPEQSFFAILYRPLVYFFLHLQMLIVGINPYALFLITIFFHALNAVLLFLLLLGFISFWESLCAALLFGFHLSLWDWMGWIAGQNQVINLTLVLLTIMLIKKYLDTSKTWYLLPAYLLYAISLFYREEALIIPLWLLLAIPLYLGPDSYIKKIIQVTSGFWIITAGYFGVRLYNFPLKTTGAGIKGHLSFTGFLYSLKDRVFDVITFLADIANLAWLPGGNRIMKGSLISLFLIIIFWLFYKNKNKLIILFCALSTIMFMWPAVWRYYSSRFLYMGLPFLVVGLVLLVTHYCYKNEQTQIFWRRNATTFCLGLTCINIMILFMHFKHREQELYTIKKAFSDLAQDSRIHEKKLCFVGLPYDTFVTGIAQAMYLHGIPTNIPVYYDNTTFIWGKNVSQNDVSITHTQNGFKITSLNAEKAWFLFTNSCMPMGKKIIINEKYGKITQFYYQVDSRYLNSDHTWITWDYDQKKFSILL